MSQTLTYLIGKQFYLGLAIGIVVALWGGTQFAQHAGKAPAIQLENLALETLDGKEFSLHSLRGSPVILYFWATWAKNPTEGLKALEQLQTELASQDLQVIAVSDEPVAYLEVFLKKNVYNILYVRSLNGLSTLGLKALPSSYLLDGEGRVVAGYLGTEAWNTEGILEKLRGDLGE